jgi:thioredoxin reductase
MIHEHDYLIIGAGPAGLQLGYFLGRQGRDYLILERQDGPGAFFRRFPRHRQLISINKVHTGIDDPRTNLRWDWNSLLSDREDLLFRHYSTRYFPHPDDLTRYLEDFARAYDIRVQYKTRVKLVRRDPEGFEVIDGRGNRFRGRRLIVATGLFKPYIPDFPGAELCETYNTHSLDLERYVNKRVLIVGKGNSAFETADHLIESAAAIHIVSPESVTMAWQTHYVGHLRAVNNNFLDTYQLKAQNAVIDASITRIEKRDGQFHVHMAYSHAKGQTTERTYDHVILCTGFRFDDSIFDESCRPELAVENKLPAQTPAWESTNVPDLYFAGILMHACDYKKTMSGFIHGFRHNIAALANILAARYHGTPWPCQRIPATPEALVSHMIQQAVQSPGIFLQPGFLCDVVVVDDAAGEACYYEDVRTDYVHTSEFGQHDHYYTLTLEYGKFEGDPFSVERDPDPEKGDQAPYLHPVIRRYARGVLLSEHHIQDDLENQWDLPEYVEPALAYMRRQWLTMPMPAVMMD